MNHFDAVIIQVTFTNMLVPFHCSYFSSRFIGDRQKFVHNEQLTLHVNAALE